MSRNATEKHSSHQSPGRSSKIQIEDLSRADDSYQRLVDSDLNSKLSQQRGSNSNKNFLSAAELDNFQTDDLNQIQRRFMYVSRRSHIMKQGESVIDAVVDDIGRAEDEVASSNSNASRASRRSAW